jgi:hypothetical protein
LSGSLADRIRQSASIQSIIQHQKREQYGAPQPLPQQQQLRASQPLPFYQAPHQYYLTDIGSVNVNIDGEFLELVWFRGLKIPTLIF